MSLVGMYLHCICYFQGERGPPGDSGCVNLRLEKGQRGDPGLPGEHGLRGDTGKSMNALHTHTFL